MKTAYIYIYTTNIYTYYIYIYILYVYIYQEEMRGVMEFISSHMRLRNLALEDHPDLVEVPLTSISLGHGGNTPE